MALVILAVFWTERIRLFIIRMLAVEPYPLAPLTLREGGIQILSNTSKTLAGKTLPALGCEGLLELVDGCL